MGELCDLWRHGSSKAELAVSLGGHVHWAGAMG